MTTTTKFNIRETKQIFPRKTDELHQFEFVPFKVRIIELEDLHFHFDSAVMLPDFDTETPEEGKEPAPRITALAILAECLRESERNKNEQILVAGHADTSGAASYNVTLSQLRADNVLFALTGEREKWIQICLKKHKVEDYQLILKWVARDWGFDCDPGEITNVQNKETTEATKKFQEEYNVEFKKSIGEDGIVGHDTWGAFFDIYMKDMQEILELKTDAELEAKRANIKFVDSAKRSVGCGENFPIEQRGVDNFRSQINRRVEVLFFTPPELPVLKCHVGKQCIPDECEVNRARIFVPTVIPVPPGTAARRPQNQTRSA